MEGHIITFSLHIQFALKLSKRFYYICFVFFHTSWKPNCYTNCGYWKYQLIARKNLQNTNFQNDAYCGYWQKPTNCNKETSKFYLPIMLTVGIEFMTTEMKYKTKYKLQYKCLKFTKWSSQMKWCQTSFVMEIFFTM